MNREEIIKLARWVGFDDYEQDNMLIAFANLVAAAEREACAKLCEDETEDVPLTVMADAIRARSQS